MTADYSNPQSASAKGSGANDIDILRPESSVASQSATPSYTPQELDFTAKDV